MRDYYLHTYNMNIKMFHISNYAYATCAAVRYISLAYW